MSERQLTTVHETLHTLFPNIQHWTHIPLADKLKIGNYNPRKHTDPDKKDGSASGALDDWLEGDCRPLK